MCVQELECLQDHLEDLVSACRDVVGNLTELESEVREEKRITNHRYTNLSLEPTIHFHLRSNLTCLFLSHCRLQDVQIDALLIRACDPVIQAHCHVRTNTHIHKPLYNHSTKCVICPHKQ